LEEPLTKNSDVVDPDIIADLFQLSEMYHLAPD